MFNFKFNNIGGGRPDIEDFPHDANTLTSTGCYIRQNTDAFGNISNIRSEALILYQDKPIMGVNRRWLIEINEETNNSEIVKQNITKPHMKKLGVLLNELVNFENIGTFRGNNGPSARNEVINQLSPLLGFGFSIVEGSPSLARYKKTKYVICIDKNFIKCINLGGEPHYYESGKDAFKREIFEETGFDIRNSRQYCIGTKTHVNLTTTAYQNLIDNYKHKYNNYNTELQSLFHGNVCVAGSNIGSKCANAVPRFPKIGLDESPNEPDDYRSNVTVNGTNYTRGIYLQKYLKYKKKYLEMKSKITNIN